ncbi:MAG TPA: D-alanyl-D-alanine endopeptidase [Steroidobacteraceae bacterium]|jgi:D-alanyl-D-alanine endopeptidase (penicillin-binding protein 7)|nr:D-alanyl-D-alanine endopeptidase [Steroidobacteraceae bacterium]
MRSINRASPPSVGWLPRALAAALLGVLAFQATAKNVNEPKLKSGSVLIVDQSDSSVLYSRNSDVAAPIASITKLMTALVVLDANQPLDEPIRITDADRDFPKAAFSRLTVGTTLTRGDLMHLALMSSENRAAHALGNNYPGGMPAMVAAMNAKAKALGMTNSHFVDPTGLSSQNVASPEDLSKLVIAASKNRTIREYSTDRNYVVRVQKHLVEFRNTDNLVANPTWNIIVQKTGYIAEAGKCLVMAAVIEGRSVVIVLLDSFGKYTRVADAQRVKTWMESASNRHFQAEIR